MKPMTAGRMNSMTEELDKTTREWRDRYFHLGQELGDIINDLQNKVLALQAENKRLKRENWNLKQTKGKRK